MKNAFTSIGLICGCLLTGAFSALAWADCMMKCKDTMEAYLYQDTGTMTVKCRIITSIKKGCTSHVHVNGGTAMQVCDTVDGSVSGDVAFKTCNGDACTPACDPELREEDQQEAIPGSTLECDDELSTPIFELECVPMGSG